MKFYFQSMLLKITPGKKSKNKGMLKQLYIKNFALIDTLDMHFQPGFSVITGETGAGKSIILGALNLLLGQRADSKMIKKNNAKCIIEAHFDLSKYNMKDFFTDNDIEFDEEDCIIRRELTATGKSRAFINDTPEPLSLVKRLGEHLIDIHSQHQNLMLNSEDFQLNVLDIISQDKNLVDEYNKTYEKYLHAKNEVKKMKEDIERGIENEEFLRFQFRELEDANLLHGIQEELEAEEEKLNHVEDIKSALYQADTILNGDGDGLVEHIKEAAKALDNIKDIYPNVSDLADRINNSLIEIKDIAQEISSQATDIDFEPGRLQQVTETLDTIYSLEHKHHTDSVDELISIKERLQNQIANIDNSDIKLKEFQAIETEALNACLKKALALSSTRRKAARIVEEGMKKRLVMLGIPNVKFAIEIEQKEIAKNGNDRVSFLFSANTNSPMQPIANVASGGEIARVMLSLKAMISSAVKLPTIIFDEIDTGVSGKIAERMAVIMQEMAQSDRQVISITHLPQIAARGTTHYKVYKEETDNGTISRMKKLGDDERIQEIAQMLSGADITEAAIKNADELLRTCRN